MSEVRLRGVTAGYGREAVLDHVDLTVREGTTTAVLGGSGSGKTTLLRVISGFLRPGSGTVEVGGRTVAGPGVWVPPERRGVAYVRQEGALFPHLSVAGNIAFGLPWPRRRHRDRVLELLELVGLTADLADRRPDQLSGGQQQRVALARALAPRPELVLLDEPFSSLDAGLRVATREATARALRASGATALLVTHDQGEALSFADEVAILTLGRFRQVDRPTVVYREPVDAEVAEFLGDAVLLAGTAADGLVDCRLGTLPVGGPVPSGEVQVMVRPEQITLTETGTGQLDATVRAVTYFGHDAVVELDLANDAAHHPLRARVIGLHPPTPGDRVGVSVVGSVRAFPRGRTAAGTDLPVAEAS
ncbi:iron(III) transport system ATP-binding protein [Raineyella antarctica]|uniref:ABC-type quaternary amine transporter n=1 Tax=Raineyella antarctica TaxID=1577474 RepID=A0A1G6I482_9ACTN|nr:ABC transporter ATP-binding protein [Raineyella antarctica]SDC01218.1 iron(III) transport system ATP-binding protein [Raineyella antarctica]